MSSRGDSFVATRITEKDDIRSDMLKLTLPEKLFLLFMLEDGVNYSKSGFLLAVRL